jgi:hypothetical protein
MALPCSYLVGEILAVKVTLAHINHRLRHRAAAGFLRHMLGVQRVASYINL